MEVLQEGPLERCINITDTKKEWKKGYFVFKKHTSSGSKTLEFFKDSNWKKQEPKGVVNLFSGYSVSIQNNAKKKYMFELVTVDKVYELYASSDTNRQKWVDILNEGLIVKSFAVTLLEYPQKAYEYIKDVRGVCHLQINETSVILVSTFASSINWKFSIIRRYKSHNGAFVIEVGRKAITGEGEFRFSTDNPVELFDVLDKAVKDRSRQRGIEDRGSQHRPSLTPINHQPKPPAVPNSTQPLPPRREPTPPNTSPKMRAHSDENRGLLLTPGLIDDNEYSHIDSISSQHAVIQKELNSDYDQLFSSDRMKKQRRSEPIIRPNQLPLSSSPSFNNGKGFQLPHFNSSQRLSVNSIAVSSPLVENDEVYVDMAGAEATNQKRPPQPPPRVNKPSVTTPSSPSSAKEFSKETLRKTLSTPTEENTYDALGLTLPNRVNSEKNSKDYDRLFNHKHSIVDSPHYSHLSHQVHDSIAERQDSVAQGDTPSTIVEDSTYDLPTPVSKPIKNDSYPKPDILSVKKTPPPKPKRPAPLVPPVAPSTRENRKIIMPKQPSINTASRIRSPTGNGVILKLKRNTSIDEIQVDLTTPTVDEYNDTGLYDSPNAAPIRYNTVGEIIPGEYHQPTGFDKDGYVKVPNENDEGEIYQTPRGEKAF